MTKQIEGTVDDDVAVKLAIGEGRQADLEQERLELQALNSERFRHRFLERNRPWILQHLVELLTPRSLEQPGHDGRPVVEYVRDVYAELMAMGEGTRKPGDRDDISSDDEDEMERARASWPRAPLKGAALVIARLWLDKARKRRAFTRHIQGLMLAQKKDACDLTGRTEAMGAKLVCTLATNGKPVRFSASFVWVPFDLSSFVCLVLCLLRVPDERKTPQDAIDETCPNILRRGRLVAGEDVVEHDVAADHQI